MRELKSFKMTSLYHNHQWPPVGAPTILQQEEPWRSQLNDSVQSMLFPLVLLPPPFSSQYSSSWPSSKCLFEPPPPPPLLAHILLRVGSFHV
ncbi:unnamed protein product [Eruca vesicaria subsp. sativa]|uniref:Uncharacterized protein n=1 Tax=Eruca vesicaria subsp. sativa TaxID=29727 RepID=A0ABC8KKM7_ERUVS|nr:unnamed protein product [Eruca vesicaria subsp. sativa]